MRVVEQNANESTIAYSNDVVGSYQIQVLASGETGYVEAGMIEAIVYDGSGPREEVKILIDGVAVASHIGYGYIKIPYEGTSTTSILQVQAGDRIIFDMMLPTANFRRGYWYSVPLNLLSEKGYLHTKILSDAGWNPNSLITREELAYTLIQALEYDTLNFFGNLNDVAETTDLGRAASTAVHFNIVEPCGDYLFCPDAMPTVAQALELISNAFSVDSKLLLDGEKGGRVKLEAFVTRAAMAKMICIAKFGPDECIETGSTEAMQVTSVTPPQATLNEPTVFTITGANLPSTTASWIGECENLQDLGGTPEQRTFSCTPSHTGGLKEGVIKDKTGGTVLYRFTVDVTGDSGSGPVVDSVTPPSALLGQSTIFTVTGSNLPDSTAFFIGECVNPIGLGGTSEQRQFQCTPSYTTGVKSGVVKDQSGGTELLTFTVDVQDPSSCTPSVSGVSPSSAVLNERTTFTVTGSCLPDSTAFFIHECVDMVSNGGSASQRSFTCTPSYATGIKWGVVKTEEGATDALENFDINVQASTPAPCTPTVDDVNPKVATIGEEQTFTITGTCLPNTTAFFIGECDAANQLTTGSDTVRYHTCMPGWGDGLHDSGEVKVETGGEVIHNFAVDYQWGDPVVSDYRPKVANLGVETQFFVTGTSLTPDVVMWIGSCEGNTASVAGHGRERVFLCTPTGEPGTRQGVIKDRPDGNELSPVTVTFQ
jgi:hypothetical protein